MSDFKTISCRMKKEETILLDDYCKKNKTNYSKLLIEIVRDILDKEKKKKLLAGENKIAYNNDRDNFSWLIELDNGEEKFISNLSKEFLENLSEKINNVLLERKEILEQKKESSVAVNQELINKKQSELLEGK